MQAACAPAGQRRPHSAVIEVGSHPEPAGRGVKRAQACNASTSALRAVGVRAAAAKGPARIAACQPSGCLSTPHRPAGNRMDSSATFASMPKPHIAVAARKAKSHLSSKTARPVVAICRTWREVHAEISTHRSTPSRIANTVIQSVSLNNWNVRWLEDTPFTAITNVQLSFAVAMRVRAHWQIRVRAGAIYV